MLQGKDTQRPLEEGPGMPWRKKGFSQGHKSEEGRQLESGTQIPVEELDHGELITSRPLSWGKSSISFQGGKTLLVAEHEHSVE